MNHDDSALRRLLEQAGPRPPLPEDDLAAIREAGRARWGRRWGGRAARSTPARWWWAAAAALVLAAGAVLVWPRATQPAAVPGAPSVASVERVAGAPRWRAVGEEEIELGGDSVGRALTVGSEITVPPAPSRLALRMVGGSSVRLDSGTRARLASANLVELESGAIYVDTGGAGARGKDVAVRTPAGLFQAFGTQFEVRADDRGDVTRLRVREGVVRLVAGNESVVTDAGRELVVDAGGARSVRPLPAWGPEWEWVVESAPVPKIEGMRVAAFLDWVGRETGRRVELADPETRSLVDSVVLHGSIGHLTPSQALAVVLPSAGLDHRVDDGRIVVSRAER